MFLALVLRRLAGACVLLLAALNLAACSSTEDRANSYYQRGMELAAKGEPVKAVLEYRNALRLKAKFPDAMFALGQAQEQQGDYQAAAQSYLAVTEQAPAHVPAKVKLSYILLAAGQADQAARYADEAAVLAADDPAVLVAQAAVALRRGDSAAGVKLANAALEKQPDNVDALMVLASERMMNADAAGAVELLDRAPEGAGSNVGLQMLRLAALDAAGDSSRTEELFRKLVADAPDNGVFRDSLVRWYLAKNRMDDAEGVVRDHAVQNPEDDQARLGLVAFLATYRNSDAALAELGAAVDERMAKKADAFTFRMALAQLQSQNGKSADALKGMESLVADTTDATKRNQARVQLARLMIGESRQADAEKIVDTIIDEDARNVEALGLRASLRLLGGDTTQSVQDLLAALNEAPDNANLHGLLAEAYEKGGSAVLAEEQYSKALDLAKFAPQTGLPAARFFLRYGKTDQAIRTLEQSRVQVPDNREVLALLAQLKLSKQDWAAAQEIADTLRKLDGNGDVAIADRIGAAALMGLNRADDSIGLLQSAISAGGDQRDVLPSLISAYVQAGKLDAARAYLDKILAENPGDVQALVLLGAVHQQAGEAELAAESLKKAADGDGLEGDVALAQYYMSLGQNEDAEKAIKVGLEDDAAYPALNLLLAAVYERTQRFDDAIGVYEKLYAADPTSNNVANDLASLLSERRGDPASLDRALEIAQRLRGSEIPQYLDTLGWIYYLRGEYDAALPLLRSAATQLANVALVHYHLGMTYFGLGQQQLAKTSLERALSTKPSLLEGDAQRAQEALNRLGEGTLPVVAPKN